MRRGSSPTICERTPTLPPFDFEYALELHTGLQGWILVEGNPENFAPNSPIFYEQRATDPAQRAVFVVDAQGVVDMAINGRPCITQVEMVYMRVLYKRGSGVTP